MLCALQVSGIRLQVGRGAEAEPTPSAFRCLPRFCVQAVEAEVSLTLD